MRQSISKFQDIETKKSVVTFCVVFFGSLKQTSVYTQLITEYGAGSPI